MGYSPWGQTQLKQLNNNNEGAGPGSEPDSLPAGKAGESQCFKEPHSKLLTTHILATQHISQHPHQHRQHTHLY